MYINSRLYESDWKTIPVWESDIKQNNNVICIVVSRWWPLLTQLNPPTLSEYCNIRILRGHNLIVHFLILTLASMRTFNLKHRNRKTSFVKPAGWRGNTASCRSQARNRMGRVPAFAIIAKVQFLLVFPYSKSYFGVNSVLYHSSLFSLSLLLLLWLPCHFFSRLKSPALSVLSLAKNQADLN